MTKLKSVIFSALLAAFTTLSLTTAVASEEPVQHLIVDDITSYQEAKQVFADTTADIKTKTKFDATDLHDIHMITYSLEKAIAYFVDNMEGEQKAAAEKMAAVVELVHLSSENSRNIEIQVYLEDYFKRAEAFSAGLN